MRHIPFLFAAAAIFAIAGCDDIVDGIATILPEPAPVPYSQADADALVSDLSAIAGSIDDGSVTATTDMPGAGSASYSGSVMLADYSSDTYGAVGAINVDVDFSSATLSGEATRFSAATYDNSEPLSIGAIGVGDELAGTLTVDGNLSGEGPTDPWFEATMVGDLTDADGWDTSYNAGVMGYFLNSGADTMVGVLSGVGTAPDESAFNIGGYMIATQE